jgi:hypothetical protein
MVDFLSGDNFAFIALGVVIIIFVIFWMRPSNIRSVEDSLQSLGNGYTIFRDILVTLKSGMYKIGYLVVSRYGLFLIDERNERGTVKIKIDQREWLIASKGGKEYIYNPLWRAREAINKLNDQGDSIPIKALIVFTKAKLKNNFNKDVISIGDLSGRVKKEHKVILDDGQVQMILDRLEKRN